MHYEKRFKRLIADLQAVMKKHMDEWNEAERGGFDIDEIMERIEAEADDPAEPVVYPKTKKPPKRTDGSEKFSDNL